MKKTNTPSKTKQNLSIQSKNSPFHQWAHFIQQKYWQVMQQQHTRNLPSQQKSKILAKELCLAKKKKFCVSIVQNCTEYQVNTRLADYAQPDFSICQNDTLTRIWVKPSSYQQEMQRRADREKYIVPLVQKSVKQIEHKIQ